MKPLVAIVSALLLLGCPFCLCGQDAKMELEKLQGEWAVVGMERQEKVSPKEFTDNLRVVFKGDTMTLVRLKGGKGTEYEIKLDPSKKPKAIDLFPTAGKAKGQTVRGIYELDGADLKLVISNTSENERPTEFKSPKGSDLIVLSLTPVKK